MRVCHFEKIDKTSTNVEFSNDMRYRKFLEVKYIDRNEGTELCVIGQNPSYADAECADKTISYIEKYVYKHKPNISHLYFINLYSIIDTDKSLPFEPNHKEFDEHMNSCLSNFDQFLIIYGRLSNWKQYRFLEKARDIKSNFQNKETLKFDLGVPYAPHPGNPKICYSKLDFELTAYRFEDII